MNIKDIKQYNSNYTVMNVTLSGFKNLILDLMFKSHLNLIPEFRDNRPESWSEQQDTSFVEYILKGGVCPKIILNKIDNSMYCVDGQQCLLAILQFLNGCLPVFDGHFKHQIDDIDILLESINLDLHFTSISFEDMIECYIRLNFYGTPHNKLELVKLNLKYSELT